MGNVIHFKNLCFLFALFFLTTGVFSQKLIKPDVPYQTKLLYKRLFAAHHKEVAFIESKLVENGLPKFLCNLALIESHFKKDAVSPAGAVGIWQFTQEHAHQYGLLPSQRIDVYKSTLVAVESLKNLYKKYGSWLSVIAAYNCGEGCVDMAMTKSRSNDYYQYAIFLPQETVFHIDKFLVACCVTNDFEQIKVEELLFGYSSKQKEIIEKIENEVFELFVTTEITSSFKLEVLSEEIGIELAKVMEWNPFLVQEIAQKGVGLLRLPTDKMPDFLLLRNSILTKSLHR